MSGGISAATIATYATIAAAAVTTAGALGAFGGADVPKVVDPVGDLAKSATTTSNRNAALIATAGGSAGETLTAGATGGRDTLFGN